MLYLTQVLNKPVIDATGETIGHIKDLAIATGEIFPRVTSVVFESQEKKPLALPWDYVAKISNEEINLTADKSKLNFSYIKPNELLLKRDLLDSQIVDTQGCKVVRVSDLKLTEESEKQLRLIGADVGLRGILRRLGLEKAVTLILKLFRYSFPERIIAWNYINLLKENLSDLKLSVTHKKLHELHPADIADILTQLDSSQRSKIFQYLDNTRAADAISEAEPELQAVLFESLGNQRASDILEIMPPDDAADIIADLPYEKAETLLNLMGVKEAADIRRLLGYRESSAGGIMTTDFTAFKENLTVEETISTLRSIAPDAETIYYIYVVDKENHLKGVVSLRDLVIASPQTRIHDIMLPDIISVGVDEDQEMVANTITKYDLLAVPVIDEQNVLLGIVTVDDVLEVVEEESSEDISIATGRFSLEPSPATSPFVSIIKRSSWLTIWLLAGALTGSILRIYSDLLKSMIAIAFFIPLVIRLSDDISSQSIALVLQTIKSGESDKKNLLRKIAIDVGAGIIISLLAGFTVVLLAYFWNLPLGLSLAIASSLTITIILASAIGALLPVVLNQFNLNLSFSTGPIVTTFMGAFGLLVYLGIAALFKT
ncbi:MAG: magnesium transporter [Actinobacteria bacterium]|nr:magnesium transporter [Actinomycetota bacterium]